MTDASRTATQYRAVTAQAWSGMLTLLLTMFIVDVVRFAMQGQYTELASALAGDPGRMGLWILIILICLNTLVQVAVRTFDAPAFRKLIVGASVAYTAFFVAHQVAHLLAGEKPGLHTILDVTHHALGLWACWASYRWSRATE